MRAFWTIGFTGMLYAGFIQGALAQQAGAQGGIGIAAVVDDQVISTVDLNDRIALVMNTTGITDTPENRSHIVPQILHQLVDEKLQLEEGKRDGITITDAKVREGVARIEQQNGKEAGSLEAFLESRHLSRLSLYAQVRAQMTWAEIVLRKIRPKIKISEQEVQHFTEHKKAEPAPTPAPAAAPVAVAADPAQIGEVLITAIHLPVDSPQNEVRMRKLAGKLVSEIRSGISFDAVATQFSSNLGKPATPFWVEMSQIDPAIARALGQTAKGGITDPVRTPTGFQIIKLVDLHQAKGAHGHEAAHADKTPSVKVEAAPVPAETTDTQAELAFKQILMVLKPDAKVKEAELLLQLAKEVQKSPGKCSEKSMAGAGDLSDMDFRVTLTRARSGELSAKLRDLLMGLKVGAASEPVITPQGVRLFMLCERIDLPSAQGAGTPASDDAIRQAIYGEKLELAAQTFMRDLRRQAFIEVRGQ